MTSKPFLHPASCFFLLTGVVMFISWVGSICEWPGVRCLLDDEGLRWGLRSVGDVCVRHPVFSVVLVLFPGVGLWLHSGLGRSCLMLLRHSGGLSRKESRALASAAVAGGIYLCVLVLLVYGSWGVADSVVGTFKGSPLEEGIWGVLSLGAAIPSVAYGFASDAYFTDRDVVRGMAYLFVRKADFFVSLFFVSLFFSSLDYTGLAAYVGISSEVQDWICTGCCILAFFV